MAAWARRLWAQDAFVYSLRVFIALSGVMALCWWRDQVALVTPLFLGIIASAIAETDDSWRGRLRAVLVMLACFAKKNTPQNKNLNKCKFKTFKLNKSI